MPSRSPRETETDGPAATEAVAAEMAAELRPGDVVLVSGELGAGKSTFVRGACRALGVEVPVTSPTFTLGRRYHGRVEVAHLDLYRVGSLEEEDPALLADYVGPDTVTFVEWPAVARGRLAQATREIKLEHLGGDRRRVQIG